MQDYKKLNIEGNTATPYDDVYRTLLNNCSKVITEKSRPQGTALIIPPAQAAI